MQTHALYSEAPVSQSRVRKNITVIEGYMPALEQHGMTLSGFVNERLKELYHETELAKRLARQEKFVASLNNFIDECELISDEHCLL